MVLGGSVLTTTYAYYGDGGPAVNSFRLYNLQTVNSSGAQLNLQYGYDAVGNVKAITDTTNSNQVQTFTYDFLNRLLSGQTNAAGSGQYNQSYQYNALGNITSMTTLGNYTYTASASGCVAGTPTTKPHAVSAAGSNTYTYDCNGNMTRRVENGVTYTQTFDVENRLVAVTTITGTTSFVYDGDGARVLLVKPDGSQTGYIGGLVEIDFPAQTGSTRIKDITFEDGSLTHPTSGADTVTGGVTLNSTTPLKGAYSASLPNVSAAYLQENFTGVDEVYVSFYLKVNALPSSDARIAFFSNQGTTVGVILLRTTGALRLRNGSTTIGSDSAALTVGTLYRVGLRQKKGTGSNAVLEAYVATGEAAFGSAFASTTSGGWTTQADRFRFGATTGTLDGVFDNIRLDSGSMPPAGAAPGGIILARWVRPAGSPVMSDGPVAPGSRRARLFVPPTGQVWRSYYYAGGQRIGMRVEGAPSNNGVFYLLTDHLGSTSVTADANGNPVSVLRYYPYGQTRYTSGVTPTTYRYTGQRSDESSTGLYFYGARYYSSLLGRFISADTIVPKPGNPQALNRFTYVNNNPIKYRDPSGHLSEGVIMQHFGVKTWQEVLAIFENGALKGRWGWLETLRTAQLGDRIQASEQYLYFDGTYNHLKDNILNEGILTASGSGRLSLVNGSQVYAADDFGRIGSNYTVLMGSADNGLAPTMRPHGLESAYLSAEQKYLHLRIKQWDRIDKISAAVDIFGFVGDRVMPLGPGGAAVWAVSEFAEFVNAPRSVDQLETGDPSGLVLNTASVIADGIKLFPQVGSIANVYSLAVNVAELSP